MFEGKCYTECPERSYPIISYQSRLRSAVRESSKSLKRDIQADSQQRDERAILNPSLQRLCGSCHFTCLICRGPKDSDCTACASDAKLNNRSLTENFCVSPVDIIGGHETLLELTKSKHMPFLVSAIILTAFGTIAVIVWSVVRLGGRNKDLAYDRIAFTISDDRAMIGDEILCESSDTDDD